jgi:ABC-type multidrug transport system ATPase subunit
MAFAEDQVGQLIIGSGQTCVGDGDQLSDVAISMKGLTKRFEKKGPAVVDNLSLDISTGTIYGLLGPNGAGKTTVVRMLSTLLKPTGGSATVNGHDVATEAIAVRASIGVLPEDTGLYDRLTAAETLQFYGGVQGVEQPLLEQRIDELLRVLNLYDRKGDKVGKFSRGMRQKLALARALVHDPDVLLLDEPTLGVDVMSTRAIREYTLDVVKRGKTVLLTTNNMYEAQMLCREFTIINKGVVRASGTVEGLEELAKTRGLEEVFVNLVKSDASITS